MTVICAGRLEYDQRPVLFPYPADEGLLAGSVIRHLDALVIWQPICGQGFFRDINADCDLHKTFLCLVLSCEPGARVSVQVETKDGGNHTHLRSMATKTKPIRPPPLPGIFGVPGATPVTHGGGFLISQD